MSTLTQEAVLHAALELPEESRLAIAEELWLSVEDAGRDKIDADWDAEIRRRLEELDSGVVIPLDAEEELTKLLKKHGTGRQ